jgi:hypothetical protein
MEKFNVYIVTENDLVHIGSKNTAEEAVAFANSVPLGYSRNISDENALVKVSDGNDYIYSTSLN